MLNHFCQSGCALPRLPFLIGDLVVDPLVLQLVAHRLAVTDLVAVIGAFIAPDYREPALAVVQIGVLLISARLTMPLSSSTARCAL